MQVHVLIKLELRELIEVDEVVMLSLIVQPVLRVLERSEIDLCSGREGPDVLAVVVPCGREGCLVQFLAPVDQVCQLWECLTQDQPTVMWDLYLPQCFCQCAVALPAALTSRTTIQSFVFPSLH